MDDDEQNNAHAERPPDGAALFYVLSFLIPVAGIILGAIYLSKPGAALKGFGKTCLTLAVASYAMACVLAAVIIVLYVAGLALAVYFAEQHGGGAPAAHPLISSAAAFAAVVALRGGNYGGRT